MAADAPAPLVARLFQRLLAIGFLLAWLSLGAQLLVLVGRRGLLPAAEYLAEVRAAGGSWWRFPTVFWLGASDGALTVGVGVGIALALWAFAGRGARVAFALSTLLYLSYVIIGQTFFSFQWDNLLLECGACAIFLRRDRRVPWTYVLFRLLVFKLYVESGIAKWQSQLGDWRDGSAMTYYYETAPLPTWLAPFAHALPSWWHHFESWATLALELVVPLAVFGPRRARLVAFGLLTAFQLVNAATANYGFFVYLALALHAFLLDDADVARAGAWLRARLRIRPRAVDRAPAATKATTTTTSPRRVLGRRLAIAGAALVLTLYAVISFVEALAAFGSDSDAIAVLAPLREVWQAPRLINTYHLFGHITRERIEPEVQISDGHTWTAHDFAHKPGDPRRRPDFIAPHQPRVDFQLWFYGLRYRHGTPRWVETLLARVCDDPLAVAALFARPLPAHATAVRLVFYRYHFSTSRGAWWTREPIDETEPMICGKGPPRAP